MYQTALKVVFMLKYSLPLCLPPACQSIIFFKVSPCQRHGFIHLHTQGQMTDSLAWHVSITLQIYTLRDVTEILWQNIMYVCFIAWCNTASLYGWNAFFDDASLSNTVLARREPWWKSSQSHKPPFQLWDLLHRNICRRAVSSHCRDHCLN